MKKFKIEYAVDVYEDSYTQGELSHVNYYDGIYNVEAKSIKEAIESFFDNELYFDINFKHMELIQDENLQRFTYDVLCDINNCEVNEEDSEYKEWLRDETMLYNNCVSFNIFEVVETEIKEIK